MSRARRLLDDELINIDERLVRGGTCHLNRRAIQDEVIYQRRLIEAEEARRKAEHKRRKAQEEQRKADRAAEEAARKLRELERAAENRGRYLAGTGVGVGGCGCGVAGCSGCVNPRPYPYPYPDGGDCSVSGPCTRPYPIPIVRPGTRAIRNEIVQDARNLAYDVRDVRRNGLNPINGREVVQDIREIDRDVRRLDNQGRLY